jgi:DNA polymerase-4
VPWKRAILHADMDAFYASVEQRDRPELQGKAIIVGGTGRRGVVTSPSYEARRFGVKSAMPMYAAMKLCPHAIAVPVRMSRYVEVSKQVMKIFGTFTPVVEPLSLDEAFLDVTGTEALFGAPVDVAWKVQKAIRDQLQLSCSVGVAANKYVAKVASDLKKPAGLVVVPPGEERAFLEPLALERLWGVGPKTAEKLHALGFVTIGDIARAADEQLTQNVGVAVGAHIAALARGEDERPVDVDRAEKSLGSERTLEFDVRGQEKVRREILALVDDIAAQLRSRKLRAGGVRLKLKYADFRRVSRELTLAEAAQDAQTLLAAIDSLLPRVDTDRPIRLVGLACTHLVDEAAPRQPSLFAGADTAPTPGPIATEKNERLGKALDKIHAKFGGDAIARAGAGPRHERTPRGE